MKDYTTSLGVDTIDMGDEPFDARAPGAFAAAEARHENRPEARRFLRITTGR